MLLRIMFLLLDQPKRKLGSQRQLCALNDKMVDSTLKCNKCRSSLTKRRRRGIR